MHYEIKVHEYFKKQVFEDNIFLIELKQVVSILNLILLNRNISRIGHETAGLFFPTGTGKPGPCSVTLVLCRWHNLQPSLYPRTLLHYV